MKKILVSGGIIALIVAIAVILAVIFSLQTDAPESSFSSSYFTSCDKPIRESILGRFSTASVSTDAVPCGSIARDILLRNGTAADAAIAGMFCVGVINAQSCGLGGGFVATYYSRAERMAYSLDAREVAPGAASPSMYDPLVNPALQGPRDKWYEKKPSANLKGGLAVAVPGESAGLYELYHRFGGGVDWKDLIEPTIQLCEKGYNLTWYTGGIMYPMRSDILAEPSLRILTHESENRVLHEGETVFRKQLAKTLRTLQMEPMALSNGSLSAALADDLAQFGGIITKKDLNDYKPLWREPVSFHLRNGDFDLHSFPPPGSGLILGLILNILDEFDLSKESLTPEQVIHTHQRVAEAFKHSYARRFQMGDLSQEESQQLLSELTSEALAASIHHKISDDATSQDPKDYGTEMVPEADQGTAHFSVLAPNGDAIAITSSINMAFGAGIRSESTGVIYNNQMADFSTGMKPGGMKMDRNLIRPGKRPLSSMSPTVITSSNGDVRLALGAAGGIMIPSSSAWVVARHLWMGQDLKEAVDECRTHHSLLPMKLQHETGFPESILEDLEKIGHEIQEYKWKSVVIGVGRDDFGDVIANADYRKSGEVQGF